MTTPLWCLFIVALMPYPLAFLGAYFKRTQLGSVDNKQPRDQSLQLQGPGARTVAAQSNAWEALAIFTVAVAIAHLAGADPESSATAAMLFVVARVLHAVFYVANLDILRSLAFAFGLGNAIWLFSLAFGA